MLESQNGGVHVPAKLHPTSIVLCAMALSRAHRCYEQSWGLPELCQCNVAKGKKNTMSEDGEKPILTSSQLTPPPFLIASGNVTPDMEHKSFLGGDRWRTTETNLLGNEKTEINVR